MTRRGLTRIGLAVSVVLTGCSTAVAGQAVPDFAKMVQIDTGNFNIEPRKVPAREPTDSERKVVAAGLLTDRMVLPNEFNAEYIGTGVRVITASHQFTTLDPLDATRIGVRGMVYAFSDSRRTAATQPIYEETGMDLVGVGGNNVYRTRDAAAAKRFIELDSALTLKDKTNVQPVTITGVPDAYCRSYGIGGVASELYYACWVAVGRYVSEFVDKQPTKTFQATAAAYRVLQQAE